MEPLSKFVASLAEINLVTSMGLTFPCPCASPHFSLNAVNSLPHLRLKNKRNDDSTNLVFLFPSSLLERPTQKSWEELYQQDAYNKLGQLPKNCRKPFYRHAQTVKARAPAGLGIDDLIQQGLVLGVLVQGQLGGHYVIPGPVQEGYLPASVGLGEQRLVVAT